MMELARRAHHRGSTCLGPIHVARRKPPVVAGEPAAFVRRLRKPSERSHRGKAAGAKGVGQRIHPRGLLRADARKEARGTEKARRKDAASELMDEQEPALAVSGGQRNAEPAAR